MPISRPITGKIAKAMKTCRTMIGRPGSFDRKYGPIAPSSTAATRIQTSPGTNSDSPRRRVRAGSCHAANRAQRAVVPKKPNPNASNNPKPNRIVSEFRQRLSQFLGSVACHRVRINTSAAGISPSQADQRNRCRSQYGCDEHQPRIVSRKESGCMALSNPQCRDQNHRIACSIEAATVTCPSVTANRTGSSWKTNPASDNSSRASDSQCLSVRPSVRRLVPRVLDVKPRRR